MGTTSTLLNELVSRRSGGQPAVEPEIARLVLMAAEVVAMALDRGAAHVVLPAEFRLPAAPRSIEGIAAARIGKLPKEMQKDLGHSAAARLREPLEAYRAAEWLEVPRGEDREDLVTRALSRGMPRALTEEARRSTRSRVHTEAAPRPARDASAPVPRAVELRIVAVHCREPTPGLGADEIHFGAVVQDLLSREAASVCGPFDLDGYEANTLRRHDVLVHRFGLVPHMRFDHTVTAAAFLAEVDFGGFDVFLAHNGAVSDREITEVAFLAMTALVGSALGMGAGATTFLALAESGNVLGPAALLGAGLGGAILGGAASLIGLAVLGVLGAAFTDTIRGLFADDPFRREALAITVSADGLIRESGAPSYRHDVGFEMGGAPNIKARYTVTFEWQVVSGPPSGLPEVAEDVGPPSIAPDERAALDNLANIDHVVVLMLENRSFDHVLGYLGFRDLADGLRPGMHVPLDGGGKATIARMATTQFPLSPGHDFCAVRRQMGIDDPRCGDDPEDLVADPILRMDGFAKQFAAVIADHHGSAAAAEVRAEDVMGFYEADQVPVFDQLARSFGIVDRWFSCFPGNTWVNRTIAFTGRPATGLSGRFIVSNFPPMKEESLFRALPDDVSWRFYSQDFSTLFAVDAKHAAAHRDHFRTMDDFLSDAAAGTLPAFSWIDPNFVDLGPLDLGDIDRPRWFITSANDDHPPSDIAHGQLLAATVFSALFRSPSWGRTLLVIVYDEHGGFHDHVAPPVVPAPVRDDERDDHFALLGLRVPALVVSPWIGRGLAVSKLAGDGLHFDHCSILKTVFARFSPDTPLPPRVAAAHHLGWLLDEPAARLTSRRESGTEVRDRRARPKALREARAAAPPQSRTLLVDRLGEQLGGLLAERPLLPVEGPPTELQEQIEAVRQELAKQNVILGSARRAR